MIKIYHEAPLSLFDQVQKETDGDYALVHLFEQNPEYFRKFSQAVADGREVILDNSIFELGEAFDMHKFASWVKMLRPAWYIVPDVLEDKDGTLFNMRIWRESYENMPGKMMGVAQGKSDEEIIECFLQLQNMGAEKIAISFDYAHWLGRYPDANKWHNFMAGRVRLMDWIAKTDIADVKVHLLGCSLPQEFAVYRNERFNFIDSLDTSNPVLHGLHGVRYYSGGLDDKIAKKMVEHIDEDHSDRWGDIKWNIDMFRWMANGTRSSLKPDKK